MPRRLAALAAALVMIGSAALAGPFRFDSIDGGTLDLDAYRGKPVLVVNTASQCGFTPQYEGLQALYETYRDRGLVVLAVPSDDFNQELATDAAVKDFCAVNFGLTLPMTTITHVRGAQAHPFYAWLASEHGIAPTWNFNKVLLDAEGQPVAYFPSSTRPGSAPMRRAIEAALGG
jgi:glutathione peroxidase